MACKSFALAMRRRRLAKHLQKIKKKYVLSGLSRQLLRSDNSIGANVEEAIGGVSRPDFTAKLGTAYKEAHETHSWLRLLAATDYLPSEA